MMSENDDVMTGDEFRAISDGEMLKRIYRGVEWLNSRTKDWWIAYAKEFDHEVNRLLNGDWLHGLNLEELDMDSPRFCVLGQAGCNYYNVIHFAELSEYEASSLGFTLDADDYEVPGWIKESDWSRLNELWIMTVEALRG